MGIALVTQDAGPRTVADWIAAGERPMSELVEISIQLAETVARIHAAGLVHRDLHPRNLVWDARLTVIDFGIATTLSGLAAGTATPSPLAGTLRYMSPEQTGRTGRSVDARADLYSIGATLYELLVGGPPFETQDPIELVPAHLARRARPPHEVNAEIPIALSRIVSLLLEKEPEQRYQTAEGLAADLPDTVQFVRDRVQQAAYALSSEERRRESHLQIGRRWLEKAADGQVDEQLESRARTVSGAPGEPSHRHEAGSGELAPRAEAAVLVDLRLGRHVGIAAGPVITATGLDHALDARGHDAAVDVTLFAGLRYRL